MKEVGREAKNCWETVTDNNIEIRLRFSLIDMILTAAGILAVVMSVSIMHRVCRDRRIKREAQKLAKEKEKA